MANDEVVPLFIVGHKRSGTTLLTRLLNHHEQIFVSSETDITWILYQFSRGISYEPYEYDGPVGMKTCLTRYKTFLQKNESSWNLFQKIQLQAMIDGFINLPPQKKSDLKYIGDQKPFQNADPNILQFVEKEFPPPLFIHMIRHPFEVLRSCKSFGPNRDGGWMWKDVTIEQIIERWTLVESWVDRINSNPEYPIHHVRYEDLISTPEETLQKIFTFLGLEVSTSDTYKWSGQVVKKKKGSIKCTLPKVTVQILEKYGYSYNKD